MKTTNILIKLSKKQIIYQLVLANIMIKIIICQLVLIRDGKLTLRHVAQNQINPNIKIIRI